MYAAGLGFQVTSLNPFLINYYEHLKGDQIVDAILNTSSMIKNWLARAIICPTVSLLSFIRTKLLSQYKYSTF